MISKDFSSSLKTDTSADAQCAKAHVAVAEFPQLYISKKSNRIFVALLAHRSRLVLLSGHLNFLLQEKTADGVFFRLYSHINGFCFFFKCPEGFVRRKSETDFFHKEVITCHYAIVVPEVWHARPGSSSPFFDR